jgi:hypothetical protein
LTSSVTAEATTSIYPRSMPFFNGLEDLIFYFYLWSHT